MKDFYSPKELIHILGLSKNTVYKYLDEGKVKATRLGKGKYRVPASEVEKLLQIHGKTNSPADSSPQKNEKTPHFDSSAGKIERKLDEVSDVVTKQSKFADLFDWFIGLFFVWVGLALFLDPVHFYRHQNLTFNSILLVGPGLIAVGFIYVLFFLFIKRSLISKRIIYFAMSLASLALAYIFAGKFAGGITSYLAVAGAFLLSAIRPKMKAVFRFVFLVFLMGILGAPLALVSPASIDPLLIELLAFGPFKFLWLFFPLLIFSLSIISLRKYNQWYQYISIFNGVCFLIFALLAVIKEDWDIVMILILLGVFSFLFPLRNRFRVDQKINLRRRFIAYFVTTTLMVIASFSLIFYAQNIIRQQAGANLIHRAEDVTWMLEEYLKEIEFEIEAFSDNELLREATQKKDWDVAEVLTKDAFRSSQRYSQVATFDNSGALRSLYPLGDNDENLMGRDFSYREYFQKSIVGEIYFSPEIFKSVSTVRPWSMTASAPIYDLQDQIVGVALFSIDLQQIQRMFGDSRVGKNGSIIIMDQAFRVVAHPDKNLLFTDFSNQLSEILEETKEGSLTERYARDAQYLKKARLSTHKSVDQYDWKVVVEQPVSEIHNSISGLVLLIVLVETIVLTGGLWIVLLKK